MKFKGTKGKWEIIEKHILETTISCGNIRVAEVKHYKTKMSDQFMNDPTHEEGICNAKLIAAAPELLKALQDLSNANQDDSSWNYQASLDQAKNAIEKALK